VCVTHKVTAQTHAQRQIKSQGTHTLTFKHTYRTHALKPSLMLMSTIAEEQSRNGDTSIATVVGYEATVVADTRDCRGANNKARHSTN
jgi:hypothetical protein